jgi:hypothetical protein
MHSIKKKSTLLSLLVTLGCLMFSSANTFAGKKLEIGENRWISIGAGLRTGFTAIEDGAPTGDDYKTDFDVQSIRLYIAGQADETIKFTFNTEEIDGDIDVLDAIAQFEFSPEFNLWLGRMLTPADRIEMNGPYYGLTWNQYTVPLFPSDQGGQAGRFGRDEGATVWGALGKFQYAFGVFDGLDGSTGNANAEDSLLYALRVAFNFWNKEDNPGYYTSSTYFGGLGDILTVALSFQSQSDGAGTTADPADFDGYAVDFLMEKVLGGDGVITVEAEFKDFETDLSDALLASGAGFQLFDGESYFVALAFLFPQKVGVGQFQPYLRFTDNSPSAESIDDSDLTEVGVNYVISGHNTRLNVSYTTGDANLTGSPGSDIDTFSFGVQIQL